MRGLILLTLIALASASPKSKNRIVGGSSTTVEEYPFMSNMQYGFGSWWFQICGGTLITNFHVVTAAHCVEATPESWLRIILGSSLRVGTGGSQHLISTIVMHEKYDDPILDNDVAILRLSTPATFSDTIQTAYIPAPSYVLSDGATVTAIGYGTLTSGGVSSVDLQHVDMDVINQELCAERYAFLKTQPGFSNWPDITDGMICAGILDVGGKDACQGDSGGPVVHNSNVLIGVTSWGYGCGDPVYPGVSARVQHYYDWILQHVV